MKAVGTDLRGCMWKAYAIGGCSAVHVVTVNGLGSGMYEYLAQAITRRIAVDTRSLAAFRIGLGSVLLIDLARRAAHIGAFYTDRGVLPRNTPSPRLQRWVDISLHGLSGEAWLQVLLFVLAGLCAIGLLVGYRTKLVTLLSVVFLVSLHARNPFVLHGGDTLLRRLLFLGLFLPLDSRWSVDAIRRGDQGRPDSVAGLASLALLLQVVFVYSTNALIKLRGDVWPSGLAIRYVFELDRYTTPLGDVLAGFPTVLATLDLLWLAALVCSPLLVVLTGYRRTLLVGVLASMHLGMLATMYLGVFPLVSIVSLLPFVPGVVWDRLSVPATSVQNRTDTRLSRLHSLRQRLRPLASTIGAVAIVAMLTTNVVALGFAPVPAGTPDRITDPTWNMFAPAPPGNDGWYVAPATLESGDRIDALQEEPLSYDRPAEITTTFPNERWRKYLWRLRSDEGRALHEPFTAYLCHRWNRVHTDRIERVQLVYISQPTRLDGPETTDRIELGTYECDSP